MVKDHMVNIGKQITYWRESAEEDWLVAGIYWKRNVSATRCSSAT